MLVVTRGAARRYCIPTQRVGTRWIIFSPCSSCLRGEHAFKL